MTKSDLVDVDAQQLWSTDSAYLLWDGESRERNGKKQGVWLPKSVCEKNDDGSFTMPESWAIDKGLI